jgi:hypothetical protein
VLEGAIESPSVKRHTVTIDDATERILLARGAELGNLSQAFRELVHEADGNNRRLRQALRGAIAAARFNCQLLRENFGASGSMRFLEQVELAHREIEAKLLAPAPGPRIPPIPAS